MNSFIKRQILKLDNKLKVFFGLSKVNDSALNSSLIIDKNGKITVAINETYKRNYHEYQIDSFMKNQFYLLNSDLKNKFGRALGEIIATDLILCFEENDENTDVFRKGNK